MTVRSALVAPTPQALGALSVDAFALFVAEDERPLSGLGGVLDWLAKGAISKYLLDGHLVGEEGETLLATPAHDFPTKRVFFFGLGAHSRITEPRFENRVKAAMDTLVRAGVRTVAIGMPEYPAADRAVPILRKLIDENGKLDAWLVGSVDGAL